MFNVNICVVVGGGVIGLLAAYLSSKTYDKVIVIDGDDKVGGLLSSFQMNGISYDYGTHIPATTGVLEVDEFLFGNEGERNDNFHKFKHLSAENYFNGKWNRTSPLLGARTLSKEDYALGILELLQKKDDTKDERSLEKYLIRNVGETFTKKLYTPVLKKLQGDVDLDDLSTYALKAFGLERIVALTDDVTNKLKEMKRYDDSLGYHSYENGIRNADYLYPKGINGIGQWVKLIVSKLDKSKVEIKTNRTVKKILHADSAITEIVFDNDESLIVDKLIWTIPPILAAKMTDISVKSLPPKFRTHSLFHFEIDLPLLKPIPQYLLCWDQNFLTYRITLYPNITEDRNNTDFINLTVEVISDSYDPNLVDEYSNKVFEELKELEVIHSSSKILNVKNQYLGSGFPVYTKDLLSNASRQSDFIKSKLSNIEFLGRASGSSFFINDLLVDAHKKLS